MELTAAMTLLILLKHLPNIQRLIAGSEGKISIGGKPRVGA